jgi:hypothetical protein
MTKVKNSSQMVTYDHIIPRAGGGSDHPENIRVVCALCNQARGVTGHCVGALVCVRAVLDQPRATVSRTASLWNVWTRKKKRLKLPPPPEWKEPVQTTQMTRTPAKAPPKRKPDPRFIEVAGIVALRWDVRVVK